MNFRQSCDGNTEYSLTSGFEENTKRILIFIEFWVWNRFRHGDGENGGRKGTEKTAAGVSVTAGVFHDIITANKSDPGMGDGQCRKGEHMSFQIESWMEQYRDAVMSLFGGRIWLMGLQGSFGRGEADEESDIDVVLVLDSLSAEDLEAYGRMLDTLPERNRVCGFLSGKEELLSWEPSDLFQFCHDTTVVSGSADQLLERIGRDDIRRTVRIGACNVYHMGVHNLLHEKSPDILKGLYKSSVFTLQAIAFLQTGRYARKRTDLLSLLQEEEKPVLMRAMEQKEGKACSAESHGKDTELLLQWASKWIRKAAECD